MHNRNLHTSNAGIEVVAAIPTKISSGRNAHFKSRSNIIHGWKMTASPACGRATNNMTLHLLTKCEHEVCATERGKLLSRAMSHCPELIQMEDDDRANTLTGLVVYGEEKEAFILFTLTARALSAINDHLRGKDVYS